MNAGINYSALVVLVGLFLLVTIMGFTAYTFVAVPAAMFALGSVSGFFAVPYTIILYPIIFIYMARLWSVSYRHGKALLYDIETGPPLEIVSKAVAGQPCASGS